jgi:hypothetical protein
MVIKMATEVFENEEVEIESISSDEEFDEVDENDNKNENENDNDNDNSIDKFDTLLNEFRDDLLKTFPELKGKIAENDELKTYCSELFPKIFFDLLYENEEIFNTPLFLLPNIDFSILMNDSQLTDKTKKTIWKYLQLILFTVVENINSKESNDTFGNTSKLFEAIKEDELHKRLTETMEEMKNLFSDVSGDEGLDISGISDSFTPDKMKEHLEGLMDGKIGSLAREIAEEATKEMGADFTKQEEFMKNMMKNPTKIFDLIKNIGSKLEDKIKTGEVKESELLEEATELLSKMKDMPGIKDMMGKMSGMNGKMDFKAMANKLQETLKMSKTKERLNKKRESRAAARSTEPTVEHFVSKNENIVITQKENNNFIVNVDGTKQEKSKINKKNNKKKEKKKSKN